MRCLSVIVLTLILAGLTQSGPAAACDGPGKAASFGFNPAAIQAIYAQQMAMKQHQMALKQQRAMKQFAARQVKQQELLARNGARESADGNNQFGGVAGSAIIAPPDRPRTLHARVMVFSP